MVVGWEVAYVFVDDVVETICSGVRGNDDQGSFRLTDYVEKGSLGRNERVRETKWCRRIDMVLWDDDATREYSQCGQILQWPQY